MAGKSESKLERDSAGAPGSSLDGEPMPLRVLVLGNFANRPDTYTQAPPLEERRPILVDRVHLDNVLRSYDVKVSMALPSPLAPSTEIRVELQIQSMSDFEPRNILWQLPEFRELLERRGHLVELRRQLLENAAFRKRLQSLLDDTAARGKVRSGNI